MTAGRDGDAQAAADVAFNAVRVLAAGWDADAADGTGLRDGDRAMLRQHARQVREALQGHLPLPLVPDIRPHPEIAGVFILTCGACGQETSTVVPVTRVQCRHCEARRCPGCGHWSGGTS